MADIPRLSGKTTIAPDVLLTIARLTTLSVPGVNRLSSISGGVNRLFKHGSSEGVRIVIENNTVYLDVYIIVDKDQNVREISRAVQTQVSRAIEEMVGMDVGRVNVHIEDIEFETPILP